MRKRLHITFNSVKGSDFVSEFFEEESGKLYKESVIESVYNNKTIITSNGKIEITKQGWSDGWMKFKYTQDKPVFYGIQECKRGVALTDLQLKKQLLQALRYRFDSSKRMQNKFKIVCLNSEKFYAYVLVSEIEDLINKLDPIFAKDTTNSASRTWQNPELKQIILNFPITFKVKKMPTEVDLADIFRDIYLNCL